jgi:flagellar hook protein FlgE
MSFYTSLSGLQAAQIDMSTISHNLANVATNGFKKSSSVFADVMASNFSTDPRRMVGSGTVLSQNRQEFGEGNLRSTGSTLDLAISGDGFFAVKSPTGSAGLSYTRNGAFQVDPDTGMIVDSQGSYLQAYPVDASGNVTASGTAGLVNVQIPETSGTPIATSSVALGVNLSTTAAKPAAAAFSRFDASSYNNATTTTIYDSAGTAMTMTNYWVRDTAADAAAGDGSTNWKVYSFVGDQQLTTGGETSNTVTFDTTGNMTVPTGAIAYDTFTPTGGAGQNVSLSLAGSTSKSSLFNLASQSQDGASVGELANIAIDNEGLITASFSNGDTLALGKVALATFTDPTGLKQMGGTYWQSTGLSGAPQIGTPNTGVSGKLMTGTLEGSNVDITEELVDLIAAQRNFQANAKALDTQTQISQTIFNIRS